MSDAAVAVRAFRIEFKKIVGAVAILSPTAFRVGVGEPVNVLPQAPGPPWGWQAEGRSGDDPLTQTLKNALYTDCYIRPSRPAADVPIPTLDDQNFPHGLAQANVGHERWDEGWVIQQFAPNGQVFVRKGERERAAAPGAFISSVEAGVASQIGSGVLLRAPHEALGAQPGYYFAFGNTLDELADQFNLVRFYFNCGATDAAGLLGALTAALNRFQVPFQMKTPSRAASYGRADALVLYVGARYVQICLRLIEEVRGTVPLEAATPLFAKPLWPGVAAAVDPGNGESFGMNRCRLTAEGIIQAWRAGSQAGSARLAAIEKVFAAEGLDLVRPWLGVTRLDPFQLAARGERHGG